MEVTHPDSTAACYPLEQLTKLHDGIEQLEDDLWGDDASDSHEMHSEDGRQIWSMDEDGVWQPDFDSNEWEELEDESDQAEHDSMDVDPRGWADKFVVDEPAEITSTKTPVPLQVNPDTQQGHQLIDPLSHSDRVLRNGDVNMRDTLPWKRFDILPSTPHDHAFFTSSPAQPQKSFFSRLTREYRVLSSSLPG